MTIPYAGSFPTTRPTTPKLVPLPESSIEQSINHADALLRSKQKEDYIFELDDWGKNGGLPRALAILSALTLGQLLADDGVVSNTRHATGVHSAKSESIPQTPWKCSPGKLSAC